VAGPDLAAALDQLLSLWRDHLADVPEAALPDTAAVVTWPCRDVGGIAALVRHGLAPFGVVAARTTGRRSDHTGLAGGGGGGGGAGAPGTERRDLRIRRATPADVDTVVGLGMRASGIGAALTARLHREIADAGVAVTLLHYEQTNPLSAPFWSQQGYRPLWTSWETRPAGTLR